MTEYTDIVEQRRLQLTEKRDAWYVHVHNAAGYTETLKDGCLTITYHDKRKKPKVVRVSEV